LSRIPGVIPEAVARRVFINLIIAVNKEKTEKGKTGKNL
jgi:hypothetical protein